MVSSDSKRCEADQQQNFFARLLMLVAVRLIFQEIKVGANKRLSIGADDAKLLAAMNSIIIPIRSAVRFPFRWLAMSALAAVTLAATSCATTRGFGQDVQKVGDKIERKASR